MHDVLVKLDVLGHDDPTMLRKLQDLTGIAPQAVPLHDPEVFGKIISLFSGPEALGRDRRGAGRGRERHAGRARVRHQVRPRQMLKETQPKSMEELIRISGLSHGTDVWVGNAQDLVHQGVVPLKECICTRDDIMNQMIACGVDSRDCVQDHGVRPKGQGPQARDGGGAW